MKQEKRLLIFLRKIRGPDRLDCCPLHMVKEYFITSSAHTRALFDVTTDELYHEEVEI